MTENWVSQVVSGLGSMEILCKMGILVPIIIGNYA